MAPLHTVSVSKQVSCLSSKLFKYVIFKSQNHDESIQALNLLLNHKSQWLIPNPNAKKQIMYLTLFHK